MPQTVKNTFVHLDEEGEDAEVRRQSRRSKTEPARAPWECAKCDSHDQGTVPQATEEDGVPYGHAQSDPTSTRAAAAPPRVAAAPAPGQPSPVAYMVMPQVPGAQVHAISIPAGLPAGSTIFISQLPGNTGFVQVGTLQGASAIPATTAAALAAQGPRGAPAVQPVQSIWAPIPAPSVKIKAPGVVKEAGNDGALRVCWTVDARKLRGTDKFVVSPAFEASPVATQSFRLMLCPASSLLKGGATFKNSRGRGCVQLKCESSMDKTLVIRMSVSKTGYGSGIVKHDFASAGVCDLGGDCNFNLAVENVSKTFDVCIEMR